jgi:hypothetical protein
MQVDDLKPQPQCTIRFLWSSLDYAPQAAGCYVLATFDKKVLYVGLASSDIRSRMRSHLQDPNKIASPGIGMPFWFFFIEAPSQSVNSIERGWLHECLLADGQWPVFNEADSPL